MTREIMQNIGQVGNNIEKNTASTERRDCCIKPIQIGFSDWTVRKRLGSEKADFIQRQSQNFRESKEDFDQLDI